MIVDDLVFEQLAVSKNSASPLATPDVKHLIALKLHAISQPSRDRTNQDWADIFALITAHNLTLDDVDFRVMLAKHGGEEAISRIQDHFDSRS